MTAGSDHPRVDLAAAAALGDALREVGYDEDAIERLLGEDGTAADADDALVFARRLPSGKLADTIRLLLLQRPVETGRFAAADALLALGLAVEAGGELVPVARVVPTEGRYLAFDGFSQGVADPPGWVASFTPTAYWLASLTPRRRVANALDVGTGNGAHALFAAADADRVIATDVNPRALGFTAISAALNGIDNVETRLGSLFEPVSGQAFDLITFNAPYVISPESRWQYRDGGLPGDQLSERVVTEAAGLLAEDGFAVVTASWLGASEDDPDVRVRAWLEGSGCDAWILGLHASDPLDHAASWNDHLRDDPQGFSEALDEWAAYFDGLGAAWITEGVVVLHKRAGERHRFRADPVDEDDLEFAGDQVERVFAGLALLAEEGARALDASRFRLADEVWFRQELDRDGFVTDLTAVLDEGTHPEVELDPAAEPNLAALGRDDLRDLLELGFLELR